MLFRSSCNVQVRYGIKKNINNTDQVTATSVVRKLLSQSRIPPNDEIIKTVLAAVPGSRFDARDLAWHKWKYKKKAGDINGNR